MKAWLTQLLSDGEMPSTMRVVNLVIVVPVMVVWTVLCIRQNTFIVPDYKIVMLIMTAIAGKYGQARLENAVPPAAPNKPTNPQS